LIFFAQAIFEKIAKLNSKFKSGIFF